MWRGCRYGSVPSREPRAEIDPIPTMRGKIVPADVQSPLLALSVLASHLARVPRRGHRTDPIEHCRRARPEAAPGHPRARATPRRQLEPPPDSTIDVRRDFAHSLLGLTRPSETGPSSRRVSLSGAAVYQPTGRSSHPVCPLGAGAAHMLARAGRNFNEAPASRRLSLSPHLDLCGFP